jgi:glc operon protein GlcG
MRKKNALANTDVLRIAAACKAKATAMERGATIAIVDDGGAPLYVERMDGPGPLSVEASTGKARTAALTRQSSKLAEERIGDRVGFLKLVLPLQGGIPLMFEGECVGGVGISGARTPQEDEEIAVAGASAL